MDKKQELAALVGRIDSYLQTKYKIESKSNEKDYEEIKSLLSELVKLFKTFKLEIPKDLLKAPQVTVKAPEVNVAAPIVNVPKAQPIVNVVERDYSESINRELKKVQKLLESVKIDSSVKNPLAVRLSDGNKFIEQLTSVVTQAVGGGSGTPTVATTLSGIRGVPVVNPDGSNIGGESAVIQYTEGDTDESITGTMMMVESDVATHTISAVNQDTPMPAQLFGDSLTALQNIDTNTAPLSNIDSTVSTLALEAGGNLQGVATSTASIAQLATTLNSLIETLQELTQRLAPLAGAMSPTAQLRTIGVVSGSVTATGGGYITSAQSIAEKAASGILFPEKIAITNQTAIQSNIQNVTVS